MLLRSRLPFAPSWTSAPVASSSGDAGSGGDADAATTQGRADARVAAKVDGAGQKNAGEPVDDGASIQIILEPRMIEKNSVRFLGR